MPLPIIQYPVYEVYLKSLDRKVKFRPFLVKEEKIFLMTKESEDNDTIVKTIKQVISNCCLEDIDVEKLPIFDVEMFFVHLRMRSVGENVKLNFTCNKDHDGEPCGFVNDYDLNLEHIDYNITPGHTDLIKLTDEVGVKMKYPVLTDVNELFNNDNIYENSIKVIAENLEYVYDAQQVYDRSKFDDEELAAFLESLSSDHINLILDFFATLPKVVIEEKVNCKKCNNEHVIFAENLYNFFI